MLGPGLSHRSQRRAPTPMRCCEQAGSEESTFRRVLRAHANVRDGLVEAVVRVVLDANHGRAVGLYEREKYPQIARIDVDAHVVDVSGHVVLSEDLHNAEGGEKGFVHIGYQPFVFLVAVKTHATPAVALQKLCVGTYVGSKLTI